MKNVIEVYHFDMNEAMNKGKSLYFIRPKEKDIIELLEEKLYKKVAEVESEDLEKAFELTNHIDKEWQSNKEVTAFSNKARSTSVGDLCVKNNEVFLVSSIGFEKMPEEILHLLESSVTKEKKNKIK